MSKNDNTNVQADVKEAEKTNAEVQADVAELEEQGYVGKKVDPTPNEAYTLAGVTSGAKTPETDPALAEEARKAAGIGTRFQHVAEKQEN